MSKFPRPHFVQVDISHSKLEHLSSALMTPLNAANSRSFRVNPLRLTSKSVM